MESLQSVKKRLKSVNNISQITKAMELVAATKMRKSQEIALLSRPYALAVLDLLGQVSAQDARLPRVLRKREVKKTLFVLMTSDKGLAGSFNSAVLKSFEKYLRENNVDAKNEKYVFAAIGEKSFSFLNSRGFKLLNKFIKVGDYTSTEQTNPVADFLIQSYLKENFDEAVVFSTHFRSALRQEVLVRKVFPVEIEAIKNTVKELIPETGKFAEIVKEGNLDFSKAKKEDFVMEPSPKILLEFLAPHLIRMQIYHLILEANASEHAARRVAMKSASDNAKEISENLTLLYNKSRQAGITKELVEITAGAESLG